MLITANAADLCRLLLLLLLLLQSDLHRSLALIT